MAKFDNQVGFPRRKKPNAKKASTKLINFQKKTKQINQQARGYQAKS